MCIFKSAFSAVCCVCAYFCILLLLVSLSLSLSVSLHFAMLMQIQDDNKYAVRCLEIDHKCP